MKWGLALRAIRQIIQLGYAQLAIKKDMQHESGNKIAKHSFKILPVVFRIKLIMNFFATVRQKEIIYLFDKCTLPQDVHLNC